LPGPIRRPHELRARPGDRAEPRRGSQPQPTIAPGKSVSAGRYGGSQRQKVLQPRRRLRQSYTSASSAHFLLFFLSFEGELRSPRSSPIFLFKVNHLFFFVFAASLVSAFGQGQLRFETKSAVLDAPVTLPGGRGPGPDFTAQLWLADPSGVAVTALSPTTTFRAAGAGTNAIANRYVNPVDVTVPNFPPGSRVILMMRVWRTSLGSFNDSAASCDRGQSNPFIITLGGGDLPPAPLTTLYAFTLGYLSCFSRASVPVITAVSVENGQLVLTADSTTDQTRVQATTKFQTWTDLNVTGTLVGAPTRTFTVGLPVSNEYFRLDER
jgi:hypothetical protein